jgi:hypothetical protein
MILALLAVQVVFFLLCVLRASVAEFLFHPILWRKSRQNVTLSVSFCAIVEIRKDSRLPPTIPNEKW